MNDYLVTFSYGNGDSGDSLREIIVKADTDDDAIRRLVALTGEIYLHSIKRHLGGKKFKICT